jgi:hypothetical protein
LGDGEQEHQPGGPDRAPPAPPVVKSMRALEGVVTN